MYSRTLTLWVVLAILMPRLAAQPVISLEGETQMVRIDRVSFRRCMVPHVDLLVMQLETKAFSRTYTYFRPQNLSFLETLGGEARAGETRRGGYFDIWELFSEVEADGPLKTST